MGQLDSCVPCPDGTIKSVSGDDPALCQNVCDGTTNVLNAQKTACGKFPSCSTADFLDNNDL